jgi:hemoglobin
MELTISKYTWGEKPEVQLPSTQVLTLLGEEGIRNLVGNHYDLLIQSEISELFPKNPIALEKAKEHAADFFIQICGGPMYFNKHRGKPMLNRRHLPFKITAEGREVWLDCYREALLKTGLPDSVLLSFWQYLDVFSKWMVNSR